MCGFECPQAGRANYGDYPACQKRQRLLQTLCSADNHKHTVDKHTLESHKDLVAKCLETYVVQNYTVTAAKQRH